MVIDVELSPRTTEYMLLNIDRIHRKFIYAACRLHPLNLLLLDDAISEKDIDYVLSKHNSFPCFDLFSEKHRESSIWKKFNNRNYREVKKNFPFQSVLHQY